ncbi:hypothetical protein G7Y89_g9446 [Cudoniella acicularis]|uniref:F-box domain-containing protein n=1 Tax=Cudoniella acicularis TaxID=354080 RepID=A0A8H4REN8_9HELO|nr:hypothetical protein G7Y89_g9446 [Cudoniella acicularis]
MSPGHPSSMTVARHHTNGLENTQKSTTMKLVGKTRRVLVKLNTLPRILTEDDGAVSGRRQFDSTPSKKVSSRKRNILRRLLNFTLKTSTTKPLTGSNVIQLTTLPDNYYKTSLILSTILSTAPTEESQSAIEDAQAAPLLALPDELLLKIFRTSNCPVSTTCFGLADKRLYNILKEARPRNLGLMTYDVCCDRKLWVSLLSWVPHSMTFCYKCHLFFEEREDHQPDGLGCIWNLYHRLCRERIENQRASFVVKH